jgi:hypothetical protein
VLPNNPRAYFGLQKHSRSSKDEIIHVKTFLGIKMSNRQKLQIKYDNINVALKLISQNQNVL